MQQSAAETLSLRVLAYIASREDVLERLLGATGLGPADLRRRAGEAEFLAGVLDFLLSDEALLMEFCNDAEINPALPARARLALPHGRAEDFP